jgi:UBX domain-containing protein 1/4
MMIRPFPLSLAVSIFRADRAARYQAAKASEEERRRTAQAAQEQLKQERASAARSAFARLQFRLPDGSTRNEQFASDVLLQDVADFIDREIRPPFKCVRLVILALVWFC